MKHFISKILVAASLSAVAIPTYAQQTKIITAEKHNEYGLVYSLPKTALSIKVKARCQTFRKGKYYKYAKKYLGTDNVISEDTEHWEILDVAVTTYGIADNENQYLMQLKAGALTYIGVDEDGMLLSINAEPKRVETPENILSDSGEISLSPDDYLKYVDDEFLASQSSAKQAELLAASLLEVRESIRDLSRGTADPMPADGKQMELMLESLTLQEKALSEAFTGVSGTRETERTFTYLPEKEERKTLFRLSDFKGFVAPDNYAGDPVYISTKIVREGSLPVDADGVEKKFPKDGVAYAIPGTANITISFQGAKLWNSDLEFAQFGTIFGLQPSIFTAKKNPSFAIFSSVTGGLLEIGTVPAANE